MNCNYSIKLPDGREIIIPATLNVIPENSTTLSKILSSYYNDQSEERINFPVPKEELIKYLSKNKIDLSIDEITSLLAESSEETFITNINNKIQEKGSIENLERAIWRWAYSGNSLNLKDASKITFNSAKKIIKSTINKKYYKLSNTLDVIGKRSFFEEKKILKEKLDELSDSGINTGPEFVIYNIINDLFKNVDKSNKKIFYPIVSLNSENDTLVINDKNNPIIFYKNESSLSLFLGLFKYMAVNNIDLNNLITVINKYNLESKNKENIININDLTLEKFFIGYFDENDKFIDSEFNKLFKENNINTIESILLLLTKDNNLKTQMLDVFKLLNPIKYGTSIFSFSEEARKFYDKNRENNKSLSNSLKINKYSTLLDKNNRVYHYSETKSISFGTSELVAEEFGKIKKITNKPIEDAYNYLKNNLIRYKDAIKFPAKGDKKYDSWNIITNFKITPKGLLIEGDKGKHLFDLESFTLEFKKLESEDTPKIHKTRANKLTTNTVIILPKSDNDIINPELVKRSLVRGAYVTYIAKNGQKYNKTVEEVYPGGILLSGNSYEVGFDNITKIVTSYNVFQDEEFTDEKDLLKKFTELSNFSKLNNSNFIEEGHIIVYNDNGQKRYNRVIDVNEKEVFILIKSNDNYVIKSILRNTVESVYFPKNYGNFTDLKNAAEVLNRINKDESITHLNYSYFNNYELSSNNDYVLIDEKLYKIINKENNIVGELPESGIGELIILSKDISLATEFITDRDISSQYAVDIAQINQKYPTTEDKIKNEKSEVIYIIKKGDSLEGALLLDNYNFTKGKVVEKSYYYDYVDGKWIPNSKLNDYVDVTQEALNIINNKYGTNHEVLFFNKINNYIERFDKHLKKYIFDSFTNETKMNSLSSGNYIVMKKENGKAENKHYRILGKTSSTITLEYSTFSDSGKIISVIKELSLEEVINNTAFYYVLYGNKEIETLDKIYKDNKDKTQTKIELLSNIANKLKSIFNIPIEIKRDSEMKNNQKARIKSEVETDQFNNVINSKDTIILNLNNEESDEYDLVHEYLHLFNIALKYNNPELYENLLMNYKKWRINNPSSLLESKLNIENVIDLSVIEEFYVEDIINFMKSKNDLPIENYNVFKQALLESISTFTTDDSTIDLEEIVKSDNPLIILKSKMSDIFPKINNGMYNSNLITFESNFRSWLSDNIDKNKIKINCN